MKLIKNLVAITLCLLIIIVGSGFTLHTHECFVKQERATSLIKQDRCDIKNTSESKKKKCCHNQPSDKAPTNRLENLCCKDFTSVFKLDIQEQIEDQKIDTKATTTFECCIETIYDVCYSLNLRTKHQNHGPPIEVLLLQNHPNYIQSYLL